VGAPDHTPQVKRGAHLRYFHMKISKVYICFRKPFALLVVLLNVIYTKRMRRLVYVVFWNYHEHRLYCVFAVGFLQTSWRQVKTAN